MHLRAVRLGHLEDDVDDVDATAELLVVQLRAAQPEVVGWGEGGKYGGKYGARYGGALWWVTVVVHFGGR